MTTYFVRKANQPEWDGLVQKRSEVLNLDHLLSPIAIVRHIEAMGDYNWFFAQAEVTLTEDVDHAEEW